mmetsp:Transcript_28696/g.68961  ORF Transcript_28696/g.68961 Transcript_28696/m.68961 type:complete len:239 (-) Transcript_28696:80-796(-)
MHVAQSTADLCHCSHFLSLSQLVAHQPRPQRAVAQLHENTKLRAFHNSQYPTDVWVGIPGQQCQQSDLTPHVMGVHLTPHLGGHLYPTELSSSHRAKRTSTQYSMRQDKLIGLHHQGTPLPKGGLFFHLTGVLRAAGGNLKNQTHSNTTLRKDFHLRWHHYPWRHKLALSCFVGHRRAGYTGHNAGPARLHTSYLCNPRRHRLNDLRVLAIDPNQYRVGRQSHATQLGFDHPSAPCKA